MNKDKIDQLFENLEGSFNTNETPQGHQHRFLDKLNTQTETKKEGKLIKFAFKKAIAIAAIVAIIVTVGSLFFNPKIITAADLASVSPEMEQTQSFFTSSINRELETLNSFKSPEAKKMVQDALKQMDILESKYELLKTDLVKSGSDQRVIYAMIQNFQNRINLLEQVINKIEEVKNLNTKKNEITI
ncbi:MAG: hypothetical protein COB12_08385 [Flavobacterium sp.]|nr:MAG: hypothetical protein COB12_08385 [Flavobacterium sp.]